MKQKSDNKKNIHGRYNPSLELAHKIKKALKKKNIEEVFLLD